MIFGWVLFTLNGIKMWRWLKRSEGEYFCTVYYILEVTSEKTQSLSQETHFLSMNCSNSDTSNVSRITIFAWLYIKQMLIWRNKAALWKSFLETISSLLREYPFEITHDTVASSCSSEEELEFVTRWGLFENKQDRSSLIPTPEGSVFRLHFTPAFICD